MSKPRKQSLTPPPPSDAPFRKGELREWRTEMAWGQQEAADALGLKLRTYQNWEQSHRKMRYPKILRTQIAQIRINRRRGMRTAAE